MALRVFLRQLCLLQKYDKVLYSKVVVTLRSYEWYISILYERLQDQLMGKLNSERGCEVEVDRKTKLPI